MYRRIIYLLLALIVLIYISINIDYDTSNNNKYINVEIKGEVIDCKTINMPLGSTINDLLNLVELNSNADLSKISLNEVLYNNEIIVIPAKTDTSLISINNADLERLICLPGIGESTAKKIINYRNTYGCFTNLEELKNVSGIGDKKYEKLKEYICL